MLVLVVVGTVVLVVRGITAVVDIVLVNASVLVVGETVVAVVVGSAMDVVEDA